jgi:hypothetical protein
MGRKNKHNRPRPGQKPVTEDARTHPPSPQHTKVVVSFEYYEVREHYCLCHLNKDQIKLFLDCLHKLTQRTWQQLLAGSSRNPANKTGLNSTFYHRTDLSNPGIWPKRLGPDIEQLLGIRASERSRVFGVRVSGVFYVLWFDEAHSIVRG